MAAPMMLHPDRAVPLDDRGGLLAQRSTSRRQRGRSSVCTAMRRQAPRPKTCCSPTPLSCCWCVTIPQPGCWFPSPSAHADTCQWPPACRAVNTSVRFCCDLFGCWVKTAEAPHHQQTIGALVEDVPSITQRTISDSDFGQRLDSNDKYSLSVQTVWIRTFAEVTRLYAPTDEPALLKGLDKLRKLKFDGYVTTARARPQRHHKSRG